MARSRTKAIGVSVTPGEHAVLRAEAQRHDLSVPALLRVRALAAVPRVPAVNAATDGQLHARAASAIASVLAGHPDFPAEAHQVLAREVLVAICNAGILLAPLGGSAPRPSGPPTHRFAGSSSARQSVGLPGHCERCAEVGHVKAHRSLGCGDVGCERAHGPGDESEEG